MSDKRVILVVEDNEANQALVQAVLELEGYRVELAASALEALDHLRDRAPDLILMDVQLPGQDGLSLTRQLKADPATNAIPVVALTAHAMTGDRELALRAGCVGYIAKPIDTRTFGAEVRRYLVDTESDRHMVVG
ncbi:MAG: response regulator [Chloroflexi bacterium]|nr:MAG: response regulator [Chloroflexota bacterium]